MLLIAAMVLAVAAARRAHPAEVSPVLPSGDWRVAWIAALGGSLALYGIGALLAARGAIRLRVAVVVAVVAQVVPLGAPLLLSKDVYAYWADARVITAHGSNPYRVPPVNFPTDPAIPPASANWIQRSPVYGPVWEWLATAPAAAVGRSQDHAQLAYRALAVLGILASLAIVAWKRRRAASVVMLGWSPLAALHFAGGGHNDSWMVAFMLLALATRSRASGGAAWPFAIAIKASSAIFLPLELARTRLRMTRAFWTGLGVAAVAIAVGATGAFGTAWITPALKATHGSSPLGGVHFLTETGLRHRYALAIATLLFAALYAALLRSAWRTGRSRQGLAASALCMAASQLRPWYGLWPAALAAMEDDAVGAVAAYAVTVYLVVWDAIPL